MERLQYLDNRLDGVSGAFTPLAGVLREESHFSQGELHGSYRTWWDNGHPKEQGGYVAARAVADTSGTKEDGAVQTTHEYGAAL